MIVSIADVFDAPRSNRPYRPVPTTPEDRDSRGEHPHAVGVALAPEPLGLDPPTYL